MLNLGQLNTIKSYMDNGQFEAMDEYINQVYGKQKVMPKNVDKIIGTDIRFLMDKLDWMIASQKPSMTIPYKTSELLSWNRDKLNMLRKFKEYISNFTA